MSYLAAHPLRVLASLIAMACGAHAEEAKDATSTADQSKVTVGATLMSDYIYRGISYSARQPSVAAYVDAQQGWLYGYTNFNSVKFSTSPAVEVTVAAGIRPTLGPLEFDIGVAYYYYPGELGPHTRSPTSSRGDRRSPTRRMSGRAARGASMRPARSPTSYRASFFPPASPGPWPWISAAGRSARPRRRAA